MLVAQDMAQILSEVVEKVVGVDRNRDAINYALRHYKADNLSFVCSSVEDFKIGEGIYDVFVSFETLEHLDDDKVLIDSVPTNTFFVFSVPSEQYAWASRFHKRAYDAKMLGERFRRFKVKYSFQHPDGKIDKRQNNVQNIIGTCKRS